MLLSPLILIGSLTIERYSYQCDKNISVIIDKNCYLGIVDYELEIEFQNSKDIKKSNKF